MNQGNKGTYGQREAGSSCQRNGKQDVSVWQEPTAEGSRSHLFAASRFLVVNPDHRPPVTMALELVDENDMKTALEDLGIFIDDKRVIASCKSDAEQLLINDNLTLQSLFPQFSREDVLDFQHVRR